MENDDLTDLRNWAHVKHISEISAEDQEKCFEMRDEINRILESYLLLPPEESEEQMQRVAKLKKEIEKLGFFINIEFHLYLKDGGRDKQVIAEIKLYTSKCKTRIVQ